VRGASPVSRAYQYITLSPHHRQAFMDNAVVGRCRLTLTNPR